MSRTLLQEMVEGKTYESLPANWSSFDLKSFSRQKQLWDNQQQARRQMIRVEYSQSNQPLRVSAR